MLKTSKKIAKKQPTMIEIKSTGVKPPNLKYQLYPLLTFYENYLDFVSNLPSI
jgi:hypothetical protein